MVIKIEENNFFGVKKENNKWYVIPINDNPTEHDYKIAEIEAKKLGLNLTEDLEIVFEIQLISKPTSTFDFKLSKEDIEKILKDLLSTSENKPDRDLFLMNTTTLIDTKNDIFYKFRPNTEICQDKIVESVRQKLLDRSNVGVKKYGGHLGNYNKYNFIFEMQNEALDFANYCEVELQKEETINQLVAKYPNNMELGSEIRKIYGK